MTEEKVNIKDYYRRMDYLLGSIDFGSFQLKVLENRLRSNIEELNEIKGAFEKIIKENS